MVTGLQGFSPWQMQRLKNLDLGLSCKHELGLARSLLQGMEARGGIDARIGQYHDVLETKIEVEKNVFRVFVEILCPYKFSSKQAAETKFNRLLRAEDLLSLISVSLLEGASEEEISGLAAKAKFLNRFPTNQQQLKALEEIEKDPTALMQAFKTTNQLCQQLAADFIDVLELRALLFADGQAIYDSRQQGSFAAALCLRQFVEKRLAPDIPDNKNNAQGCAQFVVEYHCIDKGRDAFSKRVA